MRDIELYQQLLGLAEPWAVTRVELSLGEHRVDVYVEHPRRSRFGCPEAGCEHAELPVYDHSEQRRWRHLDSMQFFTFLHARPPRVACPTHGVRQVRLAWAGQPRRNPTHPG
jgi:transposase